MSHQEGACVFYLCTGSHSPIFWHKGRTDLCPWNLMRYLLQDWYKTQLLQHISIFYLISFIQPPLSSHIPQIIIRNEKQCKVDFILGGGRIQHWYCLQPADFKEHWAGKMLHFWIVANNCACIPNREHLALFKCFGVPTVLRL